MMNIQQSNDTIPTDNLFAIESNICKVPSYAKEMAERSASTNITEHGGRSVVDMTANEFSVVNKAFSVNNKDFLDDNIKDSNRILIRRDLNTSLYTAFFYDFYKECYVCEMNLTTDCLMRTLIANGVDLNKLDEYDGKIRYLYGSKDTGKKVRTEFGLMSSLYTYDLESCKVDTRDFIGGRCYRCPKHCKLEQ